MNSGTVLKSGDEMHNARMITLRVDLALKNHGLFLFLLHHLLLANALQGIIFLPWIQACRHGVLPAMGSHDCLSVATTFARLPVPLMIHQLDKAK